MRTIEMNLPANELCGAMAEMRLWLDEHRFEPSSFCCRDNGTGVLVRVDFKVVGEADAFAERFGAFIGCRAVVAGGQARTNEVLSALSFPEALAG